jgi:AbiU2
MDPAFRQHACMQLHIMDFVNAKRIDKLEAEVESLLGLLMGAYAQFLFLRPMMVNEHLIKRIALQEKGVGFRQLRDWLYWGFIQEIVKLCQDPDDRTPSIRKLRKVLEDETTLQALKEKYSRRSPPQIEGVDQRIINHFQKQEESELRLEFDETYRRFRKSSAELLSSDALAAYKKIRDKLIAHNELHKSDAGYSFFDINILNLKYGQESQVLEAAKEIFDDLDSLVRNSSVAWNQFFEHETREVCKFWEIETIEAK